MIKKTILIYFYLFTYSIKLFFKCEFLLLIMTVTYFSLINFINKTKT